MARSPSPPVTLRPLAPADAAALRRIHATPAVRRWWGPPGAGFPHEHGGDATRLAIELGGTLAGMVQYAEELDPRYRHASVDLFVDPALHNRGVGTRAVELVVAILVGERGHHRVTIDPAGANAAAIRC